VKPGPILSAKITVSKIATPGKAVVLQSLTRQEDRDLVADEFLRNATGHSGRSPEGFRFDREDAHRRLA
jgi:hypothetical protein